MNWQEFEDNLKDTVQGHETPVDTDALWERMQPPRKRRRWFLLPLVGCFGGLLGLTALAVGLGLFWGKNESATTGHTTDSNAVVAPTTPQNVVTQAPTAAPSTTAAVPPVAPTQEVVAEPGTPGKSTTTSIAQRPPIAGDSDKTFRTQNIQNQIFTTKNLTANNSATTPTTHPTAATDSVSTTPTTTDPAVASDTTVTTPTTTAAPVVQGAQPYRPGCPRVATLLAQVNCSTCQPNDTVSRPAPTNNPPTPPQLPTLQIGAEAGVYAWQRLAQPASTTDLPRNGEQQLEAFSLGLTVQKQVHPHWAVRTGVQYQRLNSVYRWRRSWRDTLPQQVTNFYVDGSSDTTLGGTTIYLTERQVRHYNHLTQWSIPVDFQYVVQKGKYRWGPYLGVRLQYQQQASGLISGADGLPQETAFGNTYRRSLVLGAQAGVVWEMPLGPRSWLTVAPGVVVDLSRRASPTERLVQGGVQVGWRYALR